MYRLQLLRQSTKKELNRIRQITHYNPTNPNFHQILHEHTGLLLMTRKEAIKPGDIQVTYSRSPNLKDIVIQGSLESTQQPRGTTPCGKPRCKTCDHIHQGDTITKQQETYLIRGSFTCQSKNLVYLLTCSICNKHYVGETEQTLNRRCRGHESNMRRCNGSIVSKHHEEYNHTSNDCIVTAVDKETDYNKRLRLEEAWMFLQDTMHPKGLSSRMQVLQSGSTLETTTYYRSWMGMALFWKTHTKTMEFLLLAWTRSLHIREPCPRRLLHQNN